MATTSARRFALLAALVLWACPAGAAPAPADYDALLEQADDLRSLDPAGFEQKLAELTRRSGEATAVQLDRLSYLRSYQLAYSGRYDMAIEQASKLFELSQDVPTKFRAGLLIANSYAATRDFSSGLSYLENTLALMDQIKAPQLRHDGMTVAALLYNQVGQQELGLGFSEDILKSNPSDRSRCFAGYLRLEAGIALGRFAEPLENVQALIDNCAAQNEALATNLARGQLSRLLAREGKLDEAAALIERHLPEVMATRYPRLISEMQSLLAEHLLALGDIAGAEKHARDALATGSDSEYSMPLVIAHRVLYEAALSRGEHAQALAHLRNYAAADKAYLDDSQTRQMAYHLVRQETSRRVQEIALLNRQNEVLRLEQQAANLAARNTQLALALLGLLLGTLGVWTWRTRRSQQLFRRLAETDALTGIPNRMSFSHRAEAALALGKRNGEDAGLVMFDLDEFKSINDRFGHPVGDWVLQEVARACSEVCRRHDILGRLGGEEFAFLLVGCDLASSVALAQACRKRIAAIDTSATGHTFTVTASFGVAGTRACGHDFLTLLSRADDALYQAKHAGRDRVRTHGAGDLALDAAATN